MGSVVSIVTLGSSQIELTVGCEKIQDDLKLGDSVAINGVCLTVIRYDSSKAVFELSSETLKLTTFANQRLGAKVNLERALRLCDRLGGHLVQGHVDCRSQLLAKREMGEFYELEFALAAEIKKYVVQKGSIAINGISLTIANLSESSFHVAVIPHTFKQTTLCQLSIGDEVHLESDIMGRYVENLLFQQSKVGGKEKITAEFLQKHGF